MLNFWKCSKMVGVFLRFRKLSFLVGGWSFKCGDILNMIERCSEIAAALDAGPFSKSSPGANTRNMRDLSAAPRREQGEGRLKEKEEDLEEEEEDKASRMATRTGGGEGGGEESRPSASLETSSLSASLSASESECE